MIIEDEIKALRFWQKELRVILGWDDSLPSLKSKWVKHCETKIISCLSRLVFVTQ